MSLKIDEAENDRRPATDDRRLVFLRALRALRVLRGFVNVVRLMTLILPCPPAPLQIHYERCVKQ